MTRHHFAAAVGLTLAFAAAAPAQFGNYPNQGFPNQQNQWPQQWQPQWPQQQQFPQQQFPQQQFPQQFPGQQPGRDSLFPVHQFLNTQTGTHIWVINDQEAQNLQIQPGWQYEGVAFQTFMYQQPFGTRQLYRFVMPDHGRALSMSRREARSFGGTYEGPMGWVATQPAQGLVPLYAYQNPQAGRFFYTTNPNPNLPAQAGYLQGGIIAYVVPAR